MEFLAGTWYVFGIAAVAFVVLAIINQVLRAKRVMGSAVNAFDSVLGGGADFDAQSFRGMTQGMGRLVAYGLLAGICGILSVIGVVAALIG